MYRIPFSFYDFVSYLASGFILLFVFDNLFEQGWLAGGYLHWAGDIFLLVVTYVIGQINAHLASWCIEGKLLDRLGDPAGKLFEDKQGSLPSEIRDRVLSRYKEKTGYCQPGEGMFLHCFHTVKEFSPYTYQRLEQFLGLYGFARNLAFAFSVIALVTAFKAIIACSLEYLLWSGASMVASILLLARYLKFYRHYAVEIYVAYSVLRE